MVKIYVIIEEKEVSHMEGKIKNIEGAIILLTELVGKQDEQINELKRIALRLETNQIVLNQKVDINSERITKLEG